MNIMKEDKKFQPPTIGEKGKKIFIFMADFEGKFKEYKKYFHTLLILFYLILPWIHINQQQLLLIDIENRRFNIFGLALWSHDSPLIIFILAGLALVIAFVTAIWGRVWCGWACPQTVFLDSIYRHIERWVEGKHKDRRKLHEAPFSIAKYKKISLKWFLYFIVTSIITHSFLAYFVGSNNIFAMVTSSPAENPLAFTFTAVSTFLILVNFAWFREQTCLIVCPYGRFQAVLMDEHSLAVAYDEKRGEPRRQRGQKTSEYTGDCVDCKRCIEVCPTGIDIRLGIQMECLACTNCIDACDTVMTNLKKPTGLIRYTTLHELETKTKPKVIRPRVIVYTILIFILSFGFFFAVGKRQELRINAIRAIESPYQVVPGEVEMVINHYRFKVQNQTDKNILLSIDPSEKGKAQGIEFVKALKTTTLMGGSNSQIDVFIKVPKKNLQFGKLETSVEFNATYEDGSKITLRSEEIILVGPLI